MTTHQAQLLRLLTLALHGGVPDAEVFSSINGEELFNLALQTQVSSFLYPTLNQYRGELQLNEQLMRRWKETTLLLATRQLHMFAGISSIFDLFKANNIPAISLKGLVLKQLYPQPELRTMGDIDLLIDEINIQKAIELLSTQGYQLSPKEQDLNDPKWMHIVLRKPGSFSVELHRTLWHPTLMKKRSNQLWFEHIWENKRLLEIEGLQYTALSPEDELINLVIHLATHLLHTGANLQQLCDIVLFIKAYWDTMDLEHIDQTLQAMELFTFYQHLLSTCHMFLGLTTPSYPTNFDIAKSEILLQDIFNSIMHRQITADREIKKPLSERYPFARNHQFLIPLALALDFGRQFVRKTNSLLHTIPFTVKCLKILSCYNTRARYLRRIGVHMRHEE